MNPPRSRARRRAAVGLSLCFAFAVALAAPEPANCRTDRILIRPRDKVPASDIANLHANFHARVRRTFPKIGGLQVVELPSGVSVAQALVAYQRSGLVAYAEPDYIVHLLAEPNDFRFYDGSLWGLRNTGIFGGTPGADIHAPPAWDVACEARDVIVAVVDTGVRCTHDDLAANMWVNPGEAGVDTAGLDKGTNGQDDDGDGWVDDIHGINALAGTGNPDDDYGHGTHVAGIIGAVGNNSVGVCGVCWRVQLMACKFIDPEGNGAISDAITCMDYARAHGANVVNASWGGYSFTSAALRDAVNSLRDAGVIFVAACGNNTNDNDSISLFPASYEYDNNVAVAATDRTDTIAFFSNFGSHTVHLGAPGAAVFSCWNGSDSDYRYFDGTSMAAPYVAGACALLESIYPNETHHQIIRRILSTVDPVPSLAGATVSGGRLNLNAAVQPVAPPVVPPSTIWVDDDLPAGAIANANGGEDWTWTTSNPAPFSGARAHQSVVTAGQHEHSFEDATSTLEVFPGDTLFTYVYLDPVNPPREIMVSWNDGCWEHRAFWGADEIDYGVSGTSNRLPMGDLPATGQWVRLEVSAHALMLEGARLKGMSFRLVDGAATWDASGRQAGT